ncbi:MAG: hypothetical protein EP312_09675 [Gammaproteobacteria bacterium]|nr:MAG: hypothetical protein EP312_09675 [Gammaproteobacteria bacterium]
MYIRFSVPVKDDKSGKEMGVFTAGGILSDSGNLYEHEMENRKNILNWFSKNLAVPDVQGSDSNHYTNPNAISWFKASATTHIAKMREYIEILRAHDIQVDQHQTERPGKILYEDSYQIAAVPFNDTF